VLSSVDLAVESGEALALVGPSGSGKTTLLRLLNGALRPARGTVAVEGRDLFSLAPTELRAARARVGFVHQDHALVPNVRVAQNVIAGRLGQRGLLASLRSLVWPSARDLTEAHAVLERLGIEDKLFQRTDALSGGEQQRVALARALFQRPGALLADEPVASVDPARARTVIELLTGLAAERAFTLVVSLHDLALARAFFPRIVGLRRGRVCFDRRTEALSQADYDALYALAPGEPDA
jgi:phosphonate transport system ATP-binding protein